MRMPALALKRKQWSITRIGRPRPSSRRYRGEERTRMSETGCVFCAVVAALEEADTCPAGDAGHVLRKVQDLPASVAILAPDQYYRGYTLVVSKTHATELYHLDEHESTQYFRDMLRVAAAVAAAFRPRKMNYEVLGNTVAPLHWHLFPRYDEDPNPKRPTWERSHAPRLPGPDEYAETLAAIRRHLR